MNRSNSTKTDPTLIKNKMCYSRKRAICIYPLLKLTYQNFLISAGKTMKCILCWRAIIVCKNLWVEVHVIFVISSVISYQEVVIMGLCTRLPLMLQNGSLLLYTSVHVLFYSNKPVLKIPSVYQDEFHLQKHSYWKFSKFSELLLAPYIENTSRWFT